MRAIRQLRLSVTALLALRLKSGLVLGAVAVGVAAVLLTSAVGSGARREIDSRIASMGTNLLIVRPVQAARLVTRPTVRGPVTTLVPDDVAALRRSSLVRDAAPAAEFGAKIRAGRTATVATVRGTTSSYAIVRRLRVGSGRFLTDDDDRESRRVAVLGARVATALFREASRLRRNFRESSSGACRSTSSECSLSEVSLRTDRTKTTRCSSLCARQCGAF